MHDDEHARIEHAAGANIGFIAYGTTDWPLQESRHQLRTEKSVETSYLRLRALPLGDATRDFIAKYDHVYVIELNQDGQMHQLVQLHTPEYATRLRSIRNCSGLPLKAQAAQSCTRSTARWTCRCSAAWSIAAFHWC